MVKNLKQLRMKKEISQQQLADILGVSQQSINKYENHKVEPDIYMLMKMADLFGTSIDYLVGYSTNHHSTEAAKPYNLDMEESTLVETYRQLTPSQRKSIRLVMENYMQGK